MSAAFQVYKFTDDIRDGRYLTANSDGSMQWTLTRGDAHKLTRKEADTMAAWARKVFIGHMAIVVPEGKSPWEVLRQKPRGTKLNPKKRRASPAQLAARAKFAARAKAGKFSGRRRRANPKGKSKCPVCGEQMFPQNRPGYRHVPGPDWTRCKLEKISRKARSKNPARKAPPLTGFQVAALRKGKILYLSGIGLSDNRGAASLFGSLKAARHAAKQVRTAGRTLGVSKVAVVAKFDSAAEIGRFLGGA